MPLKRILERMTPKKKRTIVSENIRTEIEAGRPQKQAIAIALSKQREDLGQRQRVQKSRKLRRKSRVTTKNGSKANLRTPFKRSVASPKRRKRFLNGRV